MARKPHLPGAAALAMRLFRGFVSIRVRTGACTRLRSPRRYSSAAPRLTAIANTPHSANNLPRHLRHTASPSKSAEPMRTAMQITLTTLTLGVFWIAAVSTLRLHEMLVGVAAVALSSAFSLFVARTLPVRFRPTLANLAQVGRLPWYIVTGSGEIVLILVRDLFGRSAASLFRATRFRYLSDSGADTAQRTLATAYTTVAPNFIIVGIDAKRGPMIFHQVEASSVPVMTQNLGAEPGK